jgi:hypothetical protein
MHNVFLAGGLLAASVGTSIAQPASEIPQPLLDDVAHAISIFMPGGLLATDFVLAHRKTAEGLAGRWALGVEQMAEISGGHATFNAGVVKTFCEKQGTEIAVFEHRIEMRSPYKRLKGDQAFETITLTAKGGSHYLMTRDPDAFFDRLGLEALVKENSEQWAWQGPQLLYSQVGTVALFRPALDVFVILPADRNPTIAMRCP